MDDLLDFGLLIIVFGKGRNLPNRRTLGKQNPYCIARIAHEAKSSPPDIRGGQIPKWDHEVRFNLRDNSEQKQLKLTILDKNDSKPELIGDTVLDLQPVFDSNPRDGYDQWHELTYKGKYAGEVYLEMTFYPTKPNIPPKVERKKKKRTKKKTSADPLMQSTMSVLPPDLPPGIVPAGTGSFNDPRAFDQYVPPGYSGHTSVNGLPSLPNQSLPNHSMPAIPSQAMGHSVYGAGPAQGTPPHMSHSTSSYNMGQSMAMGQTMTTSHSMHSLGHSRPLPEAVPERALPDPRLDSRPMSTDPRMDSRPMATDPRMDPRMDPRLSDPRMDPRPDPRMDPRPMSTDPRMDPRLAQDPRTRSPGPGTLPNVPTTPSPYREPLSHSRSADPIRRQGQSPGVAPRYAQGGYPNNGSPLRPSSAGYDQNGSSQYGRPSSAGIDMPSASAAARHDIPEPLRQSVHGGRRSWGAGDSFPQTHDTRNTAPLRVNRSQNGLNGMSSRDDDLDLTVSMLKNSYGGRSVGSSPAHVTSYERDRAYDRGYEPVSGPGGQTTYSPRGSTGSYSQGGGLNSSGYSPRTSTNSHMTSSTNTMYSDDDAGDNKYKRFLNQKAPALDLPKIPTSPAQGQYGFSVKRKPVGSAASPEKPSTPQQQGEVMSYAMQRKMASLSLEGDIPFSPDSYSKPNPQHHAGTHADNPNGLSGDDILDVSTYAPEPARGPTRRLPTVPAGQVDPGHAGYKGEGQWDISDQLNAKYSDSVFHAVTQKKKVSRPPPPQDMYRKPQLPPKIPLGMTRDEYYVAEPEYDGYQGY
ncbi:Ingression protein [Yarrowia sp. C11]|nr:Ingression protein [Yarrowia sp. E02]KAG5369327.1 Ingression protein [Yarrowia sp. C11]